MMQAAIAALQASNLKVSQEHGVRLRMRHHSWGDRISHTDFREATAILDNQNPVFPPPHYTQSHPQSTVTRSTLSKTNEGIYLINSDEDYKHLLAMYPDKLIIVKFFASFCRACKALEPKMRAVMRDQQLEGLPILWAEFQSDPTTKDLFQKLGVITLPTIHFYDGSRGLVENFPCPPTKIPLLKKKLARFINSRVDPITFKLQAPDESYETPVEPRVERKIKIDNELITGEHIHFLRDDLPFFKDLTDEEFSTMIQKARLLTFNPGDIIRKQGMPGSMFYVIKRGVVEMSIKSKFEVGVSPPNYLGVVVNTLRKFDYFGERALTTGEPFAASFRSLDKVRCFAFHVDDIPPSSILSKQREANRETVEQLNQRYLLPEDYTPAYPSTQREECVLELLVRFKQIRQAAKCFDYVKENDINWGNAGEIARRTLLVRKLSYSQTNEFNEVFSILDVHHLGRISLLEMRRFMESARQSKSDSELTEKINETNLLFEDNTFITREEFMGVMAEAEFYNLLKETFQELDPENTGYVRAGDLQQVLGGVRDLIGQKRHTSIIDVDNEELLVDYEQFSKMLLGAAL